MKLRQSINWNLLMIYFLIVMVFFGAFWQFEYSVDTYSILMMSNSAMLEHFFSIGRVVTGFWYGFFSLLNIDHQTLYFISYLISIISLTIALYRLDKIFNKYITRNKVVIKILTVAILINLYSVELFMFYEKGIMVISILFAVLSFENILKYIEDKRRRQLFFAILFSLISTLSYQGTFGLLVCLAIIIPLVKYKNFKQFINNNIVVALCYGIPALINYLQIKIFYQSNRIEGDINIFENIANLIESSEFMIIDSYNLINKGIFVLFLIIAVIITITLLIKYVNRQKLKIPILGLFYIITAVYVVTIFPQILNSNGNISLTPRSTYPLAMLFGTILIYPYFFIKKEIKLKIITITITVIFLIGQYFTFGTIITQRYQSNYLDTLKGNELYQQILEYEEENNITIDKISIYTDEYTSYFNPNIYHSWLTPRALFPEWVRINYFNYHTNRQLVIIDNDNVIEEQLLQEESDNFIIQDDVIHYLVR